MHAVVPVLRRIFEYVTGSEFVNDESVVRS